MPSADVVERIGAAHLLPVLRLPDAATALRAASRCFAAGLDVVELTATTRDWAHALTAVGVGTDLLNHDNLATALVAALGGSDRRP